MLEHMKKYWEENWETICAGVIALNGGYYCPFTK